MSADAPENATPEIDELDQDEPKKRNPAERVLVWCTIIALLLVVLMEARAQQGYGKSLAALQEKIDIGEGLNLSDARACMFMMPETAGPSKTKDFEVYDFKWFSLFRWGQYELSLRVVPGDENSVAAYATAKRPEAELRDWESVITKPDPNADPNAIPTPDGEGIVSVGVTPPGEGQAGGQPRGNFDRGAIFDRMDANKDGKLDGEEISERMAPRVAQIDTDKDGAVSREEFLNAPRPSRGNGGGRPGGEGRPRGEGRPGGEGRPARPPIDGGDEKTEKTAEKTAVKAPVLEKPVLNTDGPAVEKTDGKKTETKTDVPKEQPKGE